MKENKQPILSICIPTRNRWYALNNTLPIIMEQNEFKNGNVEIVISDNASNDETEKEIRKLANEYENIRYFRNKENVGFGPNIINVLKYGNGEYLWLMGSDDYISKDSVNSILLCIEKESPSLILGNFLINSYKKLESESHLVFNHYYNIADFINNELGKCFLKDENVNYFPIYEGYFSFMSIYCFKKECFLRLLKSSPSKILYHSFNFAYLGLAIEDIDICFIRTPIICHQGDPHPKTAETKWDMNSKIVEDKIGMLRKILKKDISFKSKKYIYKMISFWINSYFMSIIIKTLKIIGVYDVLSKIWRKYFLKQDF